MITQARAAIGATGFIMAASWIAPAFAAGEPTTGSSSEAILLTQVLVLVVLGRVLGEIMYRLGQPSIIGQILAGILLGPTVLGSLWPAGEAMLLPKAPEQQAMLNGLS